MQQACNPAQMITNKMGFIAKYRIVKIPWFIHKTYPLLCWNFKFKTHTYTHYPDIYGQGHTFIESEKDALSEIRLQARPKKTENCLKTSQNNCTGNLLAFLPLFSCTLFLWVIHSETASGASLVKCCWNCAILFRHMIR